jgi:hypothetical protein
MSLRATVSNGTVVKGFEKEEEESQGQRKSHELTPIRGERVTLARKEKPKIRASECVGAPTSSPSMALREREERFVCRQLMPTTVLHTELLQPARFSEPG